MDRGRDPLWRKRRGKKKLSHFLYKEKKRDNPPLRKREWKIPLSLKGGGGWISFYSGKEGEHGANFLPRRKSGEMCLTGEKEIVPGEGVLPFSLEKRRKPFSSGEGRRGQRMLFNSVGKLISLQVGKKKNARGGESSTIERGGKNWPSFGKNRGGGKLSPRGRKKRSSYFLSKRIEGLLIQVIKYGRRGG